MFEHGPVHLPRFLDEGTGAQKIKRGAQIQSAGMSHR